MTVLHPLADACPSCFPGDYLAVTPRSVTADPGGSLCAEYTHLACGTSWAAWWDAEAVGLGTGRSRLVRLSDALTGFTDGIRRSA